MRMGETIKALRGERNLSQNDLAEALGVTRQSISKWETDHAVPDLDKLVGMSELFGVTLDALVKGRLPERGSAEPIAPAATHVSGTALDPRSHRTAGIVLLGLGGMWVLLLFLLAGPRGGIAATIPEGKGSLIQYIRINCHRAAMAVLFFRRGQKLTEKRQFVVGAQTQTSSGVYRSNNCVFWLTERRI